jgi:hypothetical protein
MLQNIEEQRRFDQRRFDQERQRMQDEQYMMRRYGSPFDSPFR